MNAAKPAPDLAIDVCGLSVAYGAKRILDNVSLELRSGEILGLIGLNGVGKTTFVKSLLDLVRPAGGVAKLFGTETYKANARRDIAYLPENLSVSRYLKGREFVELSLAYFGIKASRDAMARAAESLALEPSVLDSAVSTYSRGTMQKLGLTATLMTGRPLLILDEPMTALDPRARILLKDRLLDHRRNGGAVFFSSHILSDIDEICDRIAILSDGHILYSGEPRELRERHRGASLERAFLEAIDDSRPPVTAVARD